MTFGCLNFKKVIFRKVMRTMQKQFPVNWLTSARLAFMIQCVKARQRQQIKKMAALAEGFLHVLEPIKLSHFIDEAGQNFYINGPFKRNHENTVKTRVKATA